MIYLFAGLAALIHFYIFALESLLWSRPRTQKAFGMDQSMSEANRLFAFNQGFYNLFLAIGASLGLIFLDGPSALAGKTLVLFSVASMLGASLVLLTSAPHLKKPAIIQGLFPLLTLIAFAL